MAEESGRLQFTGSQKSQTQLGDETTKQLIHFAVLETNTPLQSK